MTAGCSSSPSVLRLQATLAGLSLIFLGWVAFATVNVIFKDRIIAAKDNRFQQMQSAYENRLADLQISYDELNGALVGAEDKFQDDRRCLAAKQNAITGFLRRKNQIEARHSDLVAGMPRRPAGADSAVASDSVGFAAAPIPSDSADTDRSSLSVMPDPPCPSRASRNPPNPVSWQCWQSVWHRLTRLASFEGVGQADPVKA